MIIDDVHRGIQKRKKRKRLGRGPGSGHGKTSGRGHKGAGSRRGYHSRTGFAGGQMPLFRLVAKRGFNNAAFADKVLAINISTLEKHFENGDEVTPETLSIRGLAKVQHDLIKILGDGDLTKKLTVKAQRFSKSAIEKIQAAGGKVEVLGE
ncbi:50S ribosomal protein L15 [Planctomicrobium piriforme]|uniref:Large ribosomal subunit protein uL15 n=1 Tax=Planctomicrobium piriforme TaxID=1576369 RepID=A0A1I3C742_9PLAN|nr:50S ribosomal protein L15 [Planctomicrobium piriforme]SFH70223.1 large subunit ribosomal protein L15 [Planctomicrobium piriforme]